VAGRGRNSNEQTTAILHYEPSLKQAGRRFDFELRANIGDSSDPFEAPGDTSFDDPTTLGSRWWGGIPSGFDILDARLCRGC
jgi:hypothetical protein